MHTLDDAGPDGTVMYACYNARGELRGWAHTLAPIRADAARNGASLRFMGAPGYDMADDMADDLLGVAEGVE